MTGKEVAEACGITRQAIRKKTKTALEAGQREIKVKEHAYRFSMVSGVGGRGSVYVYEIIEPESALSTVSSLPPQIQESPKRLAIGSLSDKKRDKLDAQIKILKEYEVFKRSGQGGLKEFLIHVGKFYPDLKISEPTFNRWRAKYKKGGAAELASKHGQNRKGTTTLKPWMQEFVLSQFRAFGTGEFNFKQLWDDLHHEAHRQGIFDYFAWKAGKVKNLCSYEVPRNFLSNYYKERLLEYSLITVGEDKTKSYLQPAQGDRKEQFSYKNQCWEIDSSPLDVIITLDGKQIRPDIISIIDVYSGRCVMDLADNSNALAIIRLLWKALKELGKPEFIKGDNGKDYLSKQFQWLLEGLGIEYDRAIAYAGDQKGGVERHFRTLQHSHIQTTIGYIGANVGHRSMIEARTPKKERVAKGSSGQNLLTQIPHELLLTWEEMEAKLEEGVILWNIDTKRNKEGISHIDRWNQCPEPKIMVDHSLFLVHAGGHEERTLGKQGISFDGRRYKGPVVDQYRTRYKKVFVAENIDNIQELFLFSPEGEFLGTAYDEKVSPMVAEDYHGALRAYSREVRKIRAMLKDEQVSLHSKTNIAQDLKEAKAAQKRLLLEQEVKSDHFDIAAQLDSSRSANVATVAAERAAEESLTYAQMTRQLKEA